LLTLEESFVKKSFTFIDWLVDIRFNKISYFYVEFYTARIAPKRS